MRTDLYMDLENLIERAWNDRSLLQEKEISIAINTIIEDLDVGRRRIAEPINGEWKVNEWLKKWVGLRRWAQTLPALSRALRGSQALSSTTLHYICNFEKQHSILNRSSPRSV